jgi:putative nucleotidyltransferase with HDIG domain
MSTATQLKVIPEQGAWILRNVPTPANVDEQIPADVVQWLAEKVLGGALQLPILPEASTLLLSMTRDENCPIQDLIDVVQRDPSLTAHLLRLANSPLYAPKYPAATLRQAIARLGFSELRNVALTIGCGARVFHVPRWESEVKQLFRHSLMTAIYASEIAKIVRLGDEEAFLSGLLHDVGQAIVLQTLADFEEEEKRKLPRAGVARAALAHHTEVGRRLVLSWGLSARVADVVAEHHDELTAPSAYVAVIHLADMLAYGEEDTLEALEKDPMIGPLALETSALAELFARRRQVVALVDLLA